MSPAPLRPVPSERLYRQIIDGLKEVVFQADPQGRWTFLNPAWTELTGFSLEETLGRDALEFVHPEDRPRAQESCRRCSSGKVESLAATRCATCKRDGEHRSGWSCSCGRCWARTAPCRACAARSTTSASGGARETRWPGASATSARWWRCSSGCWRRSGGEPLRAACWSRMGQASGASRVYVFEVLPRRRRAAAHEPARRVVRARE